MAELEPAPADGPLILASALARAGRHQEAVASLLGGGNKSPEPLTLLTAAQILLAAGEVNTTSKYTNIPMTKVNALLVTSHILNIYALAKNWFVQVKKATETLSQLPPNWKFRTGPLSTLVTLHLAQVFPAFICR